SFTTRVGTLELKVPRTRDGHFSPTVFERYQRNEKALMASMLECMYQAFQLVKYQQLWKNFVVNPSLSPSFLA
ncbi:transposase, partial [Enterococcus lactis]|uniref:transposase n=1 Tax=Enterococcus lactis TaxID=357441 RepID=UPI003C12BEA5